MIEIREIKRQSEEYQQELSVRNAVLRKPIGMDIKNDDFTEDAKAVHFGACSGNELLGVCFIVPLSETTAAIRQVAVLEKSRGLSIGKKLIQAAEARAKQDGYKKIVLQARINAWGFYEKLGYSFEGDTYIKSTIVHKDMWKTI